VSDFGLAYAKSGIGSFFEACAAIARPKNVNQ
jgi:hypothetical protein